jgi:hypothetical protein
LGIETQIEIDESNQGQQVSGRAKVRERLQNERRNMEPLQANDLIQFGGVK